ncbi:MAG: YbjN domain-containing protein [Actinomycetota bacterium]
MSDDRRPPDPAVRSAALELIEKWLVRLVADNPVVQAVERDELPDVDRWFVRVTGEEKAVFSVWFHLQQRSLHVETYVMPAPVERHAECFEYLLRRNVALRGLAFAVGDEDAVYLVGSVQLAHLDESELDRVLGSVYAYVEQHFRPAMRIGYGSRFTG